MLTKNQLNQISQDFQIDTFTVFREYLQLIFLNELYKEKEAEKIYFKGGTCLHLLYSSPRFSEDLDFSVTLSEKALKTLLERLLKRIQKEIAQVQLIFVWRGRKALRYRLNYQLKEFKYPLNIRLDFSFEKPLTKTNVSNIKTKISIGFFPLVLYLTEEEILAEKIRAFLIRAKGRDIFDFWYLLEKETPFKKEVLDKKLKEVNLIFNKKKFLQKVKKYPIKRLEKDLAKFLPRNYRKITPLLKEQILEKYEKV